MSSFADFLNVQGNLSEDRSQFVFVSNLLSLIFSVLTFGLDIILYLIFGWGPTLLLVLTTGILFYAVILLNRIGKYDAGRLLFCLIPVIMTMVITLYGKVLQPLQSYIAYFDSRFILLATTVMPAIVFELKEYVKISVCLLATFVCLIFFDPIHNVIGQGYFQKGFAVESYYYINYITFISFIALLSAIFILKWRDQKASDRLRQSLHEKHSVNDELVQRNKQLELVTTEMEAQYEEMQQQQEELQAGHEMLEKANQLIGHQQKKLQEYNLELESLVEQKSSDLVKTNEELIKSNNELRQFSFTVSHNLRGPVARLLGLTNLIRHSQNLAEISQLSQFIHQASSELDSILRDLSQIIDIRNELYRVREKISIQEEWERTIMLAGLSAERNTIVANFDKSPYIFGIRPMVQSIFYNLLSNSIKYRSPDRPHRIEVKSYSLGPDQTAFEISDNGLGIDLKGYGEDLFKLYKRFHHHVPGKGMGLYLVKSQMEIMNGKVEVESEPDKGALFRMTFKVPADVDKQVFYENDSAQLYYDANINNTVIIWKRNLTSAEYRKAFEVVLQTIKNYNTPGWIADLRNQGLIAPDDQEWFIANVLAAAAQNGLVRIGTVGFTDPVRTSYYERMKAITAKLGIELRVFNTVEAAVEWMLKFVKR